MKKLSDIFKGLTREDPPTPVVDEVPQDSQRVVKFDFSQAEVTSLTREHLATEVASMILNGTADNINIQNLSFLKPVVNDLMVISIDPDDADPMGTIKYILREAGFSGTQELNDQYHPYSSITIKYKTKDEPDVEQIKTVPVLVHEQWEVVLQHATLDVSLLGGTIENISFRPMYPRGMTPEIAHIDDSGFLPKE